MSNSNQLAQWLSEEFFHLGHGKKLLPILAASEVSVNALESRLSSFILGLEAGVRDCDSFQPKLALAALKSLETERSELLELLSKRMRTCRETIFSFFQSFPSKSNQQRRECERRCNSFILKLSSRLESLRNQIEDAEILINSIEMRKLSKQKSEFNPRAGLDIELRITLSRIEASERRLSGIVSEAEKRGLSDCALELSAVLGYLSSVSSKILANSTFQDPGHCISISKLYPLGQTKTDLIVKSLSDAGFVWHLDSESSLLRISHSRFLQSGVASVPEGNP